MSINVYLDVDGVINAVGPNRKRAEQSGWSGDWGFEKVNGWPIQYSKELVEELHKLAATDGVTIKWLTTWTDDAPKQLCPALGLDGSGWPVVGRGDRYSDKWGWWKLDAIKDDVKATTPDRIVWIDDDLRGEKDALWWALGERNVMGVSPEQSLGLSSAEVAAIHAFIAGTE